MLLIIGSNEEYHAKFIYEKAKSKGIKVEYLDTRKYPDELFITYSPNDIYNGSYLKINNKKVFIKDIKGVYWRWTYGIKYQEFDTGGANKSAIVQKECKSALDSLFYATKETNWLNPLTAIEMHRSKPYQLNLMTKNNIRIPKTLITNDVDAMRQFYEQNDKNIIYKPVSGGAYTKKMTDEDFIDSKVRNLKYCPVQLQECVDGVDVRVYAFKNNIFAAEIQSSTLDFREDKKAPIVPIELPSDIVDNCKKVLELMHLNYSGIDIRRKENGEYVFIEANPAPMFTYFEKISKYPISDTLIKELMK